MTMAMLELMVDTEARTMMVKVDGEEVVNPRSVEAYMCQLDDTGQLWRPTFCVRTKGTSDSGLEKMTNISADRKPEPDPVIAAYFKSAFSR
jgi:hypothetical protein